MECEVSHLPGLASVTPLLAPGKQVRDLFLMPVPQVTEQSAHSDQAVHENFALVTWI